ncbi:hypothetical protein [Pseudooceanicola onchidii]|uniref:hypothetical protein n=1 Tax=Pseudooceanicola onchidii TaxID=2562279 RepID=UPI00145BAF60|nr:hypothetical protein [Pseudooceanicola onchidii]
MNADQLFRMFGRRLLNRLMAKGINAGIDRASRGDRAQARQSKQAVRRVRQVMRMFRRF